VKEEEPLEPITFGDLARLLVYSKTSPSSREKKWRPASHTYFNLHCKSTLFPVFEHRLVHEITTAELQDFLDGQMGRPIVKRSGKPSGRVVKASTVAKYERILRQVLRYGVRIKRLKVSPMDGVGHTHVPRSESKRPRALTCAELSQFLDAAAAAHRAASERLEAATADDDREMLTRLEMVARQNWVFFTVLAFTGLRQLEMFRMRWSWVDLDGRQLWVREAKVGTDREDQRIPLSSRAKAALKFLGPGQPDDLVFKGWSREDGKGFTGEGDKPLTDVGYPLAKFTKAAKLDPRGIGLHCFRHTFITQLDATGCRSSVLRSLARHGREAGDMTYRYQHPEWKDLQEALAKLEKSVFGSSKVVPITAAAGKLGGR
jgi:integrase